jgi:hypothetical protein
MEKATQRKQFSKESGRDYFLVAYGGYKKGKRFLIASLLVLKVNELPTEWH